MDYRSNLFTFRRLYDQDATENYFLKAVRGNIAFHRRHCPVYADILKARKYHHSQLRTTEDLYKLPAIPTLFLKSHELRSMPKDKLLLKSTSSGTRGLKSQIGFDAKALYYGSFMVLRTAFYHKLITFRPVNYLIMGYQPNKNNQTIITKTAFGATCFAPALRRVYALKPSCDGYRLDLLRMKKALLQYSHQPFPVRLIGFPSYTYYFLQELKKSGVKLNLHKDSMVLLGGGWKQFYKEAVDKKTLYSLIEEILGIKEENCREFFGAAEHPIIYCDCKNHHFHVPVYSRVLIRDVTTLLPVKKGEIGLINLITPLLESMPLLSIMTDDLGVLHEGSECGCGITSPYFEIIGRVGVKEIKTCAAGAADILGK